MPTYPNPYAAAALAGVAPAQSASDVMRRGLSDLNSAEAGKLLRQMQQPAAPNSGFGVGSFGASLQGIDPVIGAGINIRDTPEVQLAKMQLHAENASREAMAANAADQNAIQAQGEQMRALAAFNQQQLGQQNLALSRQQFGLDQQKLAQQADQFGQRLAFDKSEAAGRDKLEQAKMQNQLDIGRLHYSPEARRAAAETGIVTGGLAAGKTPGEIASAMRQLDAILGSRAPANPNAPAGRLPASGQAGPRPQGPPGSAPVTTKANSWAGLSNDEADVVNRLVGELRSKLTPSQPGAALTREKVEGALDAIGSRSLNDNQQAALQDALGGVVPNTSAFGDLLLRSAARSLSASAAPPGGPLAGSNPVFHQDGMPFQLNSNLNALGQVLRGGNPLYGPFGRFNEIQTNNGHVIPLPTGDLVGSVGRATMSGPEREAYQKRLEVANRLLGAMMKSGAYR